MAGELKKEGDTSTIEATDAGAATGPNNIMTTNIAEIIKNKTFAIHDATTDQAVPVTAADGTTFSGTTLADVKIGGRDIAALNNDIAQIKLTDLPPGAKAVIGIDGKIDILGSDGTPLYDDIDVSNNADYNPLGGTPAPGWKIEQEGSASTIEQATPLTELPTDPTDPDFKAILVAKGFDTAENGVGGQTLHVHLSETIIADMLDLSSKNR